MAGRKRKTQPGKPWNYREPVPTAAKGSVFNPRSPKYVDPNERITPAELRRRMLGL